MLFFMSTTGFIFKNILNILDRSPKDPNDNDSPSPNVTETQNIKETNTELLNDVQNTNQEHHIETTPNEQLSNYNVQTETQTNTTQNNLNKQLVLLPTTRRLHNILPKRQLTPKIYPPPYMDTQNSTVQIQDITHHYLPT